MRAATYAAARTMTTVCLKFAVCIWQRLVAATATVRSGVLWHGAGGGAPARAASERSLILWDTSTRAKRAEEKIGCGNVTWIGLKVAEMFAFRNRP